MASSDYREKCFRYKNRECAACDATENIDVHHIDGDRTNNAIDNLEPLCEDCHTEVHNGGIAGFDYAEKLGESNRSSMRNITVRAEESTIAYLDTVAEEESIPRSDVIRDHIQFAREKKNSESPNIERLRAEREQLQERLERSQELVDRLIDDG